MSVASLFTPKNTTPHTRPEKAGNPTQPPKVDPNTARTVNVEVIDPAWSDNADRGQDWGGTVNPLPPEEARNAVLNPDDYKAVDRGGKTVLEKKKALNRKRGAKKVLRTPSRRAEQAERRQEATGQALSGNGYFGSVKGTSGWLKDYNGDGNVSWGERVRSALEWLGKIPQNMFSPGALLIYTGMGAGTMAMANAATWSYVGSLNMIAGPISLAGWALLTYLQSKETIETLGKRGEAAKLVRAAQTPDWLPKFDANANPQVFELLKEYQDGFKQSTKKFSNYKFIGLITLEMVILSSGASAFGAGFSLVALGFFFFSAAGFEIFLRMYSSQLKNLLGPEAKELVEKIVSSMEPKGVRIN